MHERREVEYPERDDIELVDVLQALADPVRLQLVHILDAADGAISCGEIPLPVSKSTGSHHLKVLHEAGLLHREKRGVWVYYRARPEAMDALLTLFADVRGAAVGG